MTRRTLTLLLAAVPAWCAIVVTVAVLACGPGSYDAPTPRPVTQTLIGF